MNEIRIEKSPQRKVAEITLYFWGLFGMVFCLYMTQKAYQFDIQFHGAQTHFGSPILAAMMHTLVWIGGLLFIGFFTLFSPVKTVLVPSQDHKSATD